MKLNVVQLTYGSYSHFTAGAVLVGDVDPVPLMNAAVSKATNGKVKHWENAHKQRRAFAAARQALLDAGFQEVTPLELWEGD